MALTDKLTAIAEAIRSKTGKTGALTLDAMPGEIEGIQTGGSDGGIGAVKFVDVDITVEASTTTAVTYTVDGLEFTSSVENPGKYNAFSANDMYFAFITPKEISEPTGEEKNIFRSNVGTANGNTNYVSFGNNISYGTNGTTTSAYGLYGVNLNCTDIVDGKPVGNMTVKVRHHSSNGYNVLPGTYNVKVYLVTDFDWGFDV